MKTIAQIVAALLSLSTIHAAEGKAKAGEKPKAGENIKTEAKGEVVEFGIFELAGAQQTVANPNTPDGAERNATGARFSKTTDRIPAQPGIQFGFRYKLTGITEAGQAEFRMVISHPPIKNEKGKVETQYSTPETLPVKDGVVSEVSGYGLDRPEELVPGVWTFEVWYHGQKLVSQSFTVYMAEAPKK